MIGSDHLFGLVDVFDVSLKTVQQAPGRVNRVTNGRRTNMWLLCRSSMKISICWSGDSGDDAAAVKNTQKGSLHYYPLCRFPVSVLNPTVVVIISSSLWIVAVEKSGLRSTHTSSAVVMPPLSWDCPSRAAMEDLSFLFECDYVCNLWVYSTQCHFCFWGFFLADALI